MNNKYDVLIQSMGSVKDYEVDTLIHFGTKRHSGRYKWGSGKDDKNNSKPFSGPVFNETEFEAYKKQKNNKQDTPGLKMLPEPKFNDAKSHNAQKDNQDTKSKSHDQQKDNKDQQEDNKDQQEEKAKKIKDEKSMDNLKMLGASGKVAKTTVELGQTVVKNHLTSKNVKTSSKMTDEELRNTTSRMELENRYINAKNIQDGRSKVNGVLSTLGSVIGVATSAATMYGVVKNTMRK